MSHYAVIAPALYSHFQALQALAGVLIDRGHRVTFIHQQEARTLVHDAHIGFEPVGGGPRPRFIGAYPATRSPAASL